MKQAMRVVFAGTPEFAAQALKAILQAGYEVPLVMTQPDRPAGRGMKLMPSAVKQVALDAALPVCQPHSLKLDGRYPDEAAAAHHALQQARPDVMVVAAYGLILPQWTLDLPRYGCLNIHASLLPRWRGAAPIQRAIEAGDTHTGITIMQMDAGLDTGDMLLRKTTQILPHHTAASLHDDLATQGAESILEALSVVAAGAAQAVPQLEQGVTYASKLEKAEAQLDFTQSAQVLERRIRAFNPFPGAVMSLPGLEQPVKVWQAQALDVEAGAVPGTVVRADAQGIDIATAQGMLRLLELQKAGGKRQPVAAFVQGWKPVL